MKIHKGKVVLTEKEFLEKYIKSLRTILLLMSIYLPILILGFYNFTASDTDAIWFQRSGSLLVLLSLLIQFLFLNLNRYINETLVDFGDDYPHTKKEDIYLHNTKEKSWKSIKQEPTYTILHEYYIWFMGTIGTIIWGYGDLIYTHVLTFDFLILILMFTIPLFVIIFFYKSIVFTIKLSSNSKLEIIIQEIKFFKIYIYFFLIVLFILIVWMIIEHKVIAVNTIVMSIVLILAFLFGIIVVSSMINKRFKKLKDL